MSYLTGYLLADRILAKSTCRRTVKAGEVIFREGDEADALYLVAEGKVEIIKAGPGGGEVVAVVGPEGIFGEIGLLGGDGRRTATARAAEDAQLVIIGENPLELLRDMGESHAAIALLKRVICALGQWVRARNQRAVETGARTPVHSDPDALESIRQGLPKGFLRFFPRTEKLAPGEILLREGEKAHGFHFLHAGVLEVVRGTGESEQVVAELHAPAVAGELGYFANEPRSATLRARGPAVHTSFAGHEFEDLEESDPERALEMLFAVARSLVMMIRAE